MSSKHPLKATDRRRNLKKQGMRDDDDDSNRVQNGSAHPAAALFNDRRKPNGSGKRAQ